MSLRVAQRFQRCDRLQEERAALAAEVPLWPPPSRKDRRWPLFHYHIHIPETQRTSAAKAASTCRRLAGRSQESWASGPCLYTPRQIPRRADESAGFRDDVTMAMRDLRKMESAYHPLVCSICASSRALTANPFIAPCRSSLTSSNTLGS